MLFLHQHWKRRTTPATSLNAQSCIRRRPGESSRPGCPLIEPDKCFHEESDWQCPKCTDLWGYWLAVTSQEKQWQTAASALPLRAKISAESPRLCIYSSIHTLTAIPGFHLHIHISQHLCIHHTQPMLRYPSYWLGFYTHIETDVLDVLVFSWYIFIKEDD